MKKTLLITLWVSAHALLLFFACNEQPEDNQPGSQYTPEQLVKRGEYLVGSIGCDDCHSPKIMGPQGPEPDPARRLSGHPMDAPVGKVDTNLLKNWVYFAPDLTAAVGPWGVSFSANLTPDETGIGNWTEEQFFKAIREGKSKGMDGTRPLLPPMPWPAYSKMSNEDLRAIFAYLKSIKPIHNVVPAPRSIQNVAQ